ncbi:hypothetical protein QBC34DRAFT_419448 [Podospora aff. communis PSN243]|uniref:Secreted protein n=1 Tax=Podospora aff. communis PSN243 TaxID=3040156 RepID=A0AAV9FWH0_9PEZI|nr:hypothetical protein QBC34DRAFT_419448 [Podospora aff. communis PSN243]
MLLVRQRPFLIGVFLPVTAQKVFCSHRLPGEQMAVKEDCRIVWWEATTWASAVLACVSTKSGSRGAERQADGFS